MADLNYLAQFLEDDSVFESVPDGSVVLVETSLDLIKHVAPLIISKLGVRFGFVLLLTDKSFVDVARDYKSNNIVKENLSVIDCVAKKEGKPLMKDTHHIDLSGLGDLETMFAAVFEELEGFSGRKFLCIDSLNELIISNGAVNMAKLLHIVLTQLRTRRIGCLMLSVQDSLVDTVRADVIQLFDKVIHF